MVHVIVALEAASNHQLAQPLAAGRRHGRAGGARMSWWAWLLIAAMLGLASAFCAMLSLSAGTAYGTDYHTLSRAQRVMARALYLGALVLAIVCGLAGLAVAGWSVKLLMA